MNGFPIEAEPKKKGGCGKAVGIGCLVVVLLAAVGGFVAARGISRFVTSLSAKYTADAPVSLPTVEATEQEVAAVKARVDSFAKAVRAGQGGQELSLDSRDINILIQKHPAWAKAGGRLHVELDGDRIKGEASLPLDDFGRFFKALKGRWLNGSATFRVETAAGRLLVFMDALSVRGAPVPDSMMAGIRAKNLAEEFAKKPEQAAVLDKLESVAVRDGRLIVRSK